MKINDLYTIYKQHPIVCTDTRQITKGCLFFALKGENFNGNEFANKAIEEGASYAIIDEASFAVEGKTIVVNNVLETLQQLANHHRHQFNIPFIGITGSNGKTTSKELVNAVLSQQYKTAFTKGNLNNHIGVPLTLLSIPMDCEMAIIEMGANHIGEIDFLCQIAEPNYGIITNIGTAHIEGFGSKEGVVQTKSEMYRFIKRNNHLLFVNKDDEMLMQLAQNNSTYTYGVNHADCMATMVKEMPRLEIEWNHMTIQSNLYGSYNFYNILLAICVGNYFKVEDHKIKKGIEAYVSSNNRSQIVALKNQEIYLDAYNANPTSMNAAMDSFAGIPSPDKLMILGDMLELGDISQEEHQKIVTKAHHLNIPTLFVGQEFKKTDDHYQFHFFDTNHSVVEWLKNNDISYRKVLIKGSRGIKLEVVADYLIKKGS